jgi:hypothetical protein
MRVGKDLEEDVNAHFKAVVWILSQQSKKNYRNVVQVFINHSPYVAGTQSKGWCNNTLKQGCQICGPPDCIMRPAAEFV